jgi:oligopeptide transport system ATP-binding protein
MAFGMPLTPSKRLFKEVPPLSQQEVILDIQDLAISFRTSAGTLQAVRHVNLTLHRGETLAIVGESGSGKSVTVRSIIGLLASNESIESGKIFYHYREQAQEKTVDLLTLKRKELIRRYCGQHIAMVFQDPMTSLNPVLTVERQLTEGMRKHLGYSRKEAYDKALALLEEVGIPNPPLTLKSYPHQLSGGMRQRVVIAIALACDPDVLICDEPTTALDVTIQAKILELIQKLQKERNLSVIYITHDMGVVAKVADFVSVMYAGKIVEQGTAQEIYFDPRHPYTWGLLLAIPDFNTSGDRLYAIPGTPPNLLALGSGDAFAPRNQYALNIDYEEEPPEVRVSDTHLVRSWLLDARAPKVQPPIQLQKRIQSMKKAARLEVVS